MHIISYTSLRVNLASVLDTIDNDRVPVVVTRQNDRKAVIIGYDEYMSYVETSYLMSSPANAERINKGIEEVEAGLTQKHELIEV